MKKIMLVDDDSTTNFLNKMIIQKSGVVDEIEVYDSADVALDFLKQDSESEPYLILLDVNMPVINGWEFLVHYSQLAPRPLNYIVMLTSSINPHDRERAESNPIVSEYRSKPLSVDVIRELVGRYFS